MNQVTRRLRELTTEQVKVRRMGRYPFDINFRIRSRQQPGYKQLKWGLK